jgi:hypothetical protein
MEAAVMLITVHDGLIFDSNEEHALLLTQANLD